MAITAKTAEEQAIAEEWFAAKNEECFASKNDAQVIDIDIDDDAVSMTVHRSPRQGVSAPTPRTDDLRVDLERAYIGMVRPLPPR